MTPQERDLVTALLARLKQQGNQPKDPEADALIRRAMAEQPDAPYLLAQTVLIQDMALRNAESRIAELERQGAEARAPQQSGSFLGSAGRGSVPSAGVWTRSGQPQAPAAAPSSGWSPAGSAPAGGAPAVMPGAGGGFLQHAAATAAGVAGGALLFQGIQSLFGPHYGGGMLAGMQPQPGLSETVINNYYGDQGGQDALPGVTQADAGADPGQDYADHGVTDTDQDVTDADFADQDFGGGDDSSFDV